MKNAAALVLWILWTFAAQAEVLKPVPASHVQAALPGKGSARVVTQLMWDAGKARLVRARFEVRDVLDLPEAEVIWRPDAFSADVEGATGPGTLVWMQPGAAAYQAGAVIATLKGGFENGVLQGQGRYWHRSGASYAGGWRDGAFDGAGHLHRADGTVYTGAFRAGLPHGEGKLVARDGTIYRGSFYAGAQDGDGTLFPAQDRAFRAHWRAGTQVGARQVIGGQAGVAHVIPVQQPAFADVALGISVNKAKPASVHEMHEFHPFYDSFTQDSVLYVYPGAFADVWHGDAQAALNFAFESGWSSQGVYPEVSFNLDLNNTGVNPLTVVGGRLQIAQSQTDLDPVLTSEMQPPRGGRYFCQEDAATTIEFESFGWSDPINASINSGFMSRNGNEVVLSLGGPVSPTWPVSKTNLRPALVQAGVAIQAIEAANLSCPSGEYEACLESVKTSQMFGPLRDALFVRDNRIFAKLVGTITYDWRNNAGVLARKIQNFREDVFIAAFDWELQCGEGSEYTKLYETAINLPTDQQNYAVPFPIYQTVQPGTLQRWTFQIDSAKATRHIFQVVLQLSDGREIATRTVDLNYFKPRDPHRDRY